jgi:protein-S-isoprenylcysteine O-methyltransferase Ste14
MQRIAFFLYGVACHGLFLGVYAYLACFMVNLFVPKSVDSGRPIHPLAALAINLALLAAFSIQHSVMARPAFKRWWTQYVPQPIERSTYVLASCIAMIALLWLWQPMPAVIWDLSGTAAEFAMWGLFAFGVLMVPGVSLLINHFDLFGTRQVWLHLRGKPYTHLPFRTPLLYSRIRHPLYVGWMVFFWATPVMTAGHLLFALVNTLYMILAIRFEERDLVSHFGKQYEDYRRQVPALLPRLKKPALQAGPAMPAGE